MASRFPSPPPLRKWVSRGSFPGHQLPVLLRRATWAVLSVRCGASMWLMDRPRPLIGRAYSSAMAAVRVFFFSGLSLSFWPRAMNGGHCTATADAVPPQKRVSGAQVQVRRSFAGSRWRRRCRRSQFCCFKVTQSMPSDGRTDVDNWRRGCSVNRKYRRVRELKKTNKNKTKSETSR